MRTPTGFTLVELMIVIVIIGILTVVAYPSYMNMQDRAKESRVTSNAHTVQLAAEDYAVQNEGAYSAAQDDLRPLLPDGDLVANAFTGVFTEPQFNAAAVAPGQIGIVPVVQGGNTTGYIVNGWGKEGQILVFSSGQ